MGQFTIDFLQVKENNIEDVVIVIYLSDAWESLMQIQTSFEYNKNTIYSLNNSTSYQNCVYGIIGDGKNIKFYRDDVLLATTEQIQNLSFNKIRINFQKYQNYSVPTRNDLERLYIGDIKYYKDIVQ